MDLQATGIVAFAAVAGLAAAASADVFAAYDFTAGSAASTDTNAVGTASDYDPRSDAFGGTGNSNISAGTETAFVRATATGNSSSPADDTNPTYHAFTLTVDNLGVDEVLNLTSLDINYFGTSTSFGGSNFFIGIYTPSTGLVDVDDKLGGGTMFESTGPVAVSVDLTNANSVAGSAFTGLGNGDSIEFRIYFGDNSSGQQRIHRVDDIVLNGRVVPAPGPMALMAIGGLGMLRRRR